MVDELMDEHEQGERARAWLRENGSGIIAGVAIGVALLFGFDWWKQAEVEKRLTAATQFQALQDAAQRQDRDAVDVLSSSLAKEFGRTSYAAWAKLTLADQQLAAGELAAARESLDAVISDTKHPVLADLARVRLARVTLATGDAEAALKQLEAIGEGSFVAVAAELRGDALQALGRSDDARAAYELAASELEPMSPGRRLVEMKLIDAGGSALPALES